MKKLFLIAAAVSVSTSVFAQRKNVNTAEAAIGREEFEDAKTAIDAAAQDESTKGEAKTWYVRGNVYNAMAYSKDSSKYKALDPKFEAAKSYLKMIEIDPEYKKDETDNALLNAGAQFALKAGAASDSKDFAKAAEYYGTAIKIYTLGNGKRYAENAKNVEAALAYWHFNRAYAYYNAKDYNNSIPDLLLSKESAIIGAEYQASSYQMLFEAYEALGKKAELESSITEARKKFPDNTAIRNRELNLFSQSGRQDELIKKLEDAVAKDPANAEFQFNLGMAYYQKAFPPATGGKEAAKPANFDEYTSKAEKAYLAMIAADKSNSPTYQFYIGVLYFNLAADINKTMNAADDDTYNKLKSKRDELLGKSQPFLDNTYQAFDKKNVSSLDANEKEAYLGAILSLQKIYALQGKPDKAKEMRTKFDQVNK